MSKLRLTGLGIDSMTNEDDDHPTYLLAYLHTYSAKNDDDGEHFDDDVNEERRQRRYEKEVVRCMIADSSLMEVLLMYLQR